MKPGWTEVALGELMATRVDRVDPARHADESFQLFSIPAFDHGEPETARGCEIGSSKQVLERGDVLLSRIVPHIRRVWGVNSSSNQRLIGSSEWMVFRTERVDHRYLVNLLRSTRLSGRLTQTVSGVGGSLLRFRPQLVAQIQVPLPPIEEQRRIAGVLDLTDALLQRHRSAFGLVDLIESAAFQAAFGDPVANPRGWPAGAVLADVSSIASGITKGRKVKGSATRTVPYLAVANVQAGRLALNSVKTIDATGEEIERYRLADGDLVLTEGGDPDKLGRGTVWRSEIAEATHQNHIFRVRITDPDRFDPEFLVRLVGSERGRRYFLRSAKQTTGIASINKSQLSAFPLLEPPIALQRRFVEELTTINRLRTRALRRSARLDALFASLQDRAFRGDL